VSGLGDALARAAGWLVDPEPHGGELTTGTLGCPATQTAERGAELRLLPAPLPGPIAARPFVAVVGLAPGCGATTVARALAATLARRDHSGAAIVASAARPGASRVATRPASRLAARLASVGLGAGAAGRLCLTHVDAAIPRLAPVVLDLGSGHAAARQAAEPVLLIASGEVEPALADLAAENLGALTVVVSPDDTSRWEGRAFITLPRSRLGAQLAAAGWEPRGAFGSAIARIADACEEAAA
jgi:hypothetical protein